MTEEKMGVNNSSVTPAEQPQPETTEDNTSSSSVVNQVPQSSGVTTAGAKTYTEEDLNRILHTRTKEYSEKIKKLEEELNKYKQSSSSTNKESLTSDDLSAEDKLFLDYFKTKILPRLDIGLKSEQQEIINAIIEREKYAQQMYLQSGENYIKEQAAEMKLNEDGVNILKDMVAAKILNDETMLQRFKMRDPNVFKDAFESIKASFKTVIENKAKEEVKNIVKTKQVTTQVKQPVSGIGAPITEKKPLTDEELLEMAFQRVKQGG